MEQRKIENDCLWMLKGISCILVILFHCPIKGIVGDGIIYALRFPIPIFFMSTGYFMYGKENYLSKAKLYLKYVLLGESVACISLMVKSFMDSSFDSIIYLLSSNLTLKTLFYGSVFNGTLWYLYAMIWTYVLLYVLSKFRNGFRMGYCLIIPLLFIHIAGRVFVTNHFDINELVFIFRSAVLFAIPFVLIGRFIAQIQDRLKEYLNYVNISVVFFLGIALMFFEYFRWHQFMDLQVSTIFISIAMFLFALYKPTFRLFGIFRYIGKNLLLYVYIFHIPVINMIQPIFKKAGLEESNVIPLMVVVLTIGLSYIGVELSKIVKIQFRRDKGRM
ncbi:MAG: acyltransferase family protein [Eubacteriales bacterium]|nr:acyltransferase family protein [Eubacteriales bacterium]